MRTTIFAVIAASAVVLTGCTAAASAPAPTTAPETTTTTATSVAPVTRAAVPTTATAVYKPGQLRPQDRAYLANLNDWWRTAPNDKAIETGESVCTRFNRGDSKIDILGDMVEIAGSTNGINLMYSAVSAYCPQHLVGIK